MADKIKGITIRVHPSFFDGWFEPTRRKYERKTGHPISQIKFTRMIVDKWKLTPKKTFLPKELRRFKFYIS